MMSLGGKWDLWCLSIPYPITFPVLIHLGGSIVAAGADTETKGQLFPFSEETLSSHGM